MQKEEDYIKKKGEKKKNVTITIWKGSSKLG